MNRVPYTPEQDAEHMGCRMGCDLLNELLTFKQFEASQTYALRAVHDKLHALSKMEHANSAAGGFAAAIVNVLEVGIANLPKVPLAEVEE